MYVRYLGTSLTYVSAFENSKSGLIKEVDVDSTNKALGLMYFPNPPAALHYLGKTSTECGVGSPDSSCTCCRKERPAAGKFVQALYGRVCRGHLGGMHWTLGWMTATSCSTFWRFCHQSLMGPHRHHF